MASDPALMSASELTDLFWRRTLGPVEALRAVEARIADKDPAIRAFVALDKEGSLAAARASEARWAIGRPLGPLDGVPASVKDLLDLRGFPTRAGSLTTSDAPAATDSPAVAGLKQAGAVILGKTATTEFGWKAPGDSPHSGTTRNPWNIGRTPGGSSSGAAAAAAAGFGPLHIGTDAGGSVRLPAAWCGLVGLKPTAGRVPNWPLGAFAHVASAGPMTRTVADAVAMYTAMARPDPRDPFCLPADASLGRVAELDSGVAGLRVGLLDGGDFEAPFPAGDGEAVREAASILAGCGAVVEEVGMKLPDLRHAFDAHWSIAVDRVVRSLGSDARRDLDPVMVEFADDHGGASAVYFLDSEVRFARFAGAMEELLRRFDLVLCPCVPEAAVRADTRLEGKDGRRWTRWGCWTCLFNISRQPALSMPMGLDGDGLPRSVQIVAGRYREDLVFRAARCIEASVSMPWERI